MKWLFSNSMAVAVAPPAAKPARSETMWAQTSRRLRKSHAAILGMLVVVCLVLVAIFADVLAPHSPTANNPSATFQAPSAQHLLGTDQLGRDMMSRIIHGSRVSLTIGLSSV